jgi:hypothetical protein
MRITPSRRCTLALVSTLLAILLLRPLIADALCIRGDEFLRSGEPFTAQHYYRLALVGDPNCGTAVERFVFASLEIHRPTILAAGVKVADAYLQRHEDQAIAIDRALALWSMNDFARAAKELRVLGDSTHDRRYARLAEIAMRRTARIRR